MLLYLMMAGLVQKRLAGEDDDAETEGAQPAE